MATPTPMNTPSPASTSRDEQIQKDVLAELKFDPRVVPNEIGVSVKDGIVSLTGHVESYTKKWAAEEAALRVRGVQALANDVEVRLPASSTRTDTELAAAVTHALEWDASLAPESINCAISAGWVTLKGDVEWHYQKVDAERIVRRIGGVNGVTNLIGVKPRLDASELKQKIENALVRSVRADAERIRVDIEGTQIVLRGHVKSWAEREEAERAAWLAPGVTAVENLLQIAYN